MSAQFIKSMLLALLAAGSFTTLRAQQAEVGDNDTQVVEFHQLFYPALARNGRVQGAVVVRVTLNGQGNVTEATALSGHESLVRTVLPNIKTWIFKPNAKKSAIVIYNFIMLPGECDSQAGSLFVLQHKNVATVITCPPNVNESSSQ